MPVRAEMRQHYGREWREVVRPRIRARATERRELEDGGVELVLRCECDGRCGEPHRGGRCAEVHGTPALSFAGPVVITVAHLDQDPTHNDDDNLMAACQACHNRIDGPHRARNSRRTRSRQAEEGRRAAGQVALFDP